MKRDDTRQLRIGRRTIEVSNPGKILYPDGYTKMDVLGYYQLVAERMLVHSKHRPISMQRFPHGVGQLSFYEKRLPTYFPAWVGKIQVRRDDGGTQWQVAINDTATLLYLAELEVLTPHLWLSTAKHLDLPDRMIFDLDPSPGAALSDVRFGVTHIRQLLKTADLTPFLMTTGSRGYHVVVPLLARQHFRQVRTFAQRVAGLIASKYPKRLTIEHRKAKRGRRVYIDTNRNAYGQTAVAPYALRARPHAPVAAPLFWHELTRIKPDQITLATISRRLSKPDPWQQIFRHAKRLPPP